MDDTQETATWKLKTERDTRVRRRVVAHVDQVNQKHVIFTYQRVKIVKERPENISQRVQLKHLVKEDYYYKYQNRKEPLHHKGNRTESNPVQ